MKVLRPLLGGGGARDGAPCVLGATAGQQLRPDSQGVYRYRILIIDRHAMMKHRGHTKSRGRPWAAGRSLLFSPDFANAVVAAALRPPRAGTEPAPNVRAMAAAICLQRSFKACKASFDGLQSSDELIKALGASGLRGRSGLKR